MLQVVNLIDDIRKRKERQKFLFNDLINDNLQYDPSNHNRISEDNTTDKIKLYIPK